MSLRTRRSTLHLVTLLLALLLAGPLAGLVRGAEPAKESEIRDAAQHYVSALQNRDADVLAACWTAEGTYVDADGKSSNARDLIRSKFGSGALESGSVSRASDLAADYDSTIQFVAPGVAIEEGKLEQAGKNVHFSATWIKSDQKWWLSHLREWKSASQSQASVNHPLSDLDWMLGNWVGTADGMTVRWKGSWSEDRQFIIRHFQLERDGKVLRTGDERIGLDPESHTVRSWTFNSDGSVSESHWRSEGDAWVVQKDGRALAGDASSAIQFWVPKSKTRCAFKSSHLSLGDTDLDDVVVQFTRIDGQVKPEKVATVSDTKQEEPVESREELLQSEQWKELLKSFKEWLSVQTIYTKEEVAELEKGLQQRVESMSAGELKEFMKDTKERLEVLMGDDAAVARDFLSHFTMTARKSKLASLGDEQNVFKMTVSQLREELKKFDKQLQALSSSSAAFRRQQDQQIDRSRREADRQRSQAEQANRDRITALREDALIREKRQRASSPSVIVSGPLAPVSAPAVGAAPGTLPSVGHFGRWWW